MKYIMYEIRGMDSHVPIIFPNRLVHKLVHDEVMRGISRSHMLDLQLVSAGDVSLFGGEVTTSGESSTLKVKSRPQDAQIIECLDYTGGAAPDEFMLKVLAKAKAIR